MHKRIWTESAPVIIHIQEGIEGDGWGSYLCTRGYRVRVRKSLSIYKRVYRETVGGSHLYTRGYIGRRLG